MFRKEDDITCEAQRSKGISSMRGSCMNLYMKGKLSKESEARTLGQIKRTEVKKTKDRNAKEHNGLYFVRVA